MNLLTSFLSYFCKFIRDIRSQNFNQIVDVPAIHFQGQPFFILLLKTIGPITISCLHRDVDNGTCFVQFQLRHHCSCPSFSVQNLLR